MATIEKAVVLEPSVNGRSRPEADPRDQKARDELRPESDPRLLRK
jgi:hypothetical protein